MMAPNRVPRGASGDGHRAFGRVSSIAITHDGKLLAYGAGNTVYLRTLDTDKEVHKFTAADGIHMLVLYAGSLMAR